MESYHFHMQSGDQEYRFDLVQTDKKDNAITIGKTSYSIVSESPYDLDAIFSLISQADIKACETIFDLKENLTHLPSLQQVKLEVTKKTREVAKTILVSTEEVIETKTSFVAGAKASLMDARLQEYRDMRGFQGAVCVVEKGNTILRAGYGFADSYGSEITPDMPFPIGSLTKPITALAVLDLLEKGHFRINDTILKQPQEVKIVDFLPKECLPSDPRVLISWESITLLDLLNHTSGLPSFEELGEKIMQAKNGEISQSISPNTIISLILDRPLQHKSDYNYSNFGYHLLGKIIEKVSKKTYPQYMNEFLSEMGVTHSGYVGSDLSRYPSPMIYDGFKTQTCDRTTLDPPEEAYSSGGLYSTVDDLAKLVTKCTFSEPLDAVKVSQKYQDYRSEYFCHLGWNYSQLSGEQEVWKNGAVGGFGSLLVTFPQTQSSLIILSNQPSDVERFIARDLASMLTSETAKSAELRMQEKVSAMLFENQRLAHIAGDAILQQKRDVAKSYWERYVLQESGKDHCILRHFLASSFPDPLYIHKEFDEAVKQKDFARFASLFEPLVMESIVQINTSENLGALQL